MDTAARLLREEILSGALPPGSRLTLAPLADRLSISVIPVRECLQRLEGEGLIDHVPHKGARVRSITVADLLDLYRIRIQMEGNAIADAAVRITPDDERRLREILAQYQRAYELDRPAEGQALHASFHLELYALAGSPWLLRAIRPLWDASERYQRYAGRLRGDIQTRYDGHLRLLESCMTGDPVVAADALEDHLLRSQELIRREVAQEVSSSPERVVATTNQPGASP